MTASMFIFSLLPLMWVTPLKVHAGKVLIIPLHGSQGSHYFAMSSIAKELVKRGHNITMLVNQNYNYREDLSLYNNDENNNTSNNSNSFVNIEFFNTNATKADYREYFKGMMHEGLKYKYGNSLRERLLRNHYRAKLTECQSILSDTELILRLNATAFNLVLVDSFCQCPVPQYLNIPYVVVSMVLNLPFQTQLENRFPLNPSFVPTYTSGFDHKMAFYERFLNFLYTINSIELTPFLSDTPYGKLRGEYGISEASSKYSDAELWLVNTNFAFDFPRPLMPNTVAVGGLTTKPPGRLNHDLETFLESAGDDGVVLFSMGSYADWIDDDVSAKVAGAFSQLSQKVIWKFLGNRTFHISPNVQMMDWIPQNDLLGHRQVKVFLSHCGMNGVWEAIYHGVPMVALPLYRDQHDNAQRIVSRGIGLKIDISCFTSDELADALRKVINDTGYLKNAKRLSAIFRDAPRTPPELAVDWLEYVVRHDGAKHLRSAALDMNSYQFLLIDVFLALAVIGVTLIIIVFFCCMIGFKSLHEIIDRYSATKIIAD